MDIRKCINYLLTEAQHKVSMKMKKGLEEFGITPIQYGVLKCLWQLDIHNPKEMAGFLGIENSTISGILERMEKKGLIERKIDLNDRRYIYVDLAEKSAALEKPVDKFVEALNKEVFKDFTAEEAQQTREYLARIIAG